MISVRPTSDPSGSSRSRAKGSLLPNRSAFRSPRAPGIRTRATIQLARSFAAAASAAALAAVAAMRVSTA